LANKNNLQIPESERGELLIAVSVSRDKVALQSGGYMKTLVMGIIGSVAGILFAIAGFAAGFLLLGVFGFLIVLAGWRMWIASQQKNATDEALVAYEVRTGGVLIPSNFFIPWDEIGGATYQWRKAGGGVAVGRAGAAAKQTYDTSMAAHGLDNAKRLIEFDLIDYKKTNSRSGGNHIGMISGPMLGFPGTGAANLSGTVDDATFTTILEVTSRELLARGKTISEYNADAAGDAARAHLKASIKNRKNK
jgi:hypothetical protein